MLTWGHPSSPTLRQCCRATVRSGKTRQSCPSWQAESHLEAIKKSLSPCLMTSLGNTATTTRPSAAAQPPTPAVSLTYSHAGEATGKLTSSGLCCSTADPCPPSAGGKKPAQVPAGDGCLSRHLPQLQCQQSCGCTAVPHIPSPRADPCSPQPQATHPESVPSASSWVPPNQAKGAWDRGQKN